LGRGLNLGDQPAFADIEHPKTASGLIEVKRAAAIAGDRKGLLKCFIRSGRHPRILQIISTRRQG